MCIIVLRNKWSKPRNPVKMPRRRDREVDTPAWILVADPGVTAGPATVTDPPREVTQGHAAGAEGHTVHHPMTPDILGPILGLEPGQGQDVDIVQVHRTAVTRITADPDLVHPGHIQVHAHDRDLDHIDPIQEVGVGAQVTRAQDQGHIDVHDQGIVLVRTVIHHDIPIPLLKVPKSIIEYAVVT